MPARPEEGGDRPRAAGHLAEGPADVAAHHHLAVGHRRRHDVVDGREGPLAGGGHQKSLELLIAVPVRLSVPDSTGPTPDASTAAPADQQRVDLRLVQAELGQELTGVLAEQGRPEAGLGRAAAEVGRGGEHGQAALLVGDLDHGAGGMELLVDHDVVDGVDRAPEHLGIGVEGVSPTRSRAGWRRSASSWPISSAVCRPRSRCVAKRSSSIHSGCPTARARAGQ